jgi:hypothetical protein
MGRLERKDRAGVRLAVLALAAAQVGAAGSFVFRDSGVSLELSEDGRPVLAYVFAPVLQEGAAERFRRSTYIHPLHAPDGTVITDDFPKDHPHHRGLCWAWPAVTFEGRTYDVWAVEGMHQRFVGWLAHETSPHQARLAVENGWFVGGRKAVKEIVEILVHPAAGNRRRLDLSLTLEAVDSPVVIAGREQKGYGGLGIRFAPRESTRLRTEAGVEAKDSDLARHPWAELEGVMKGRRAGARVEPDPRNPGAPSGWCLRHYGYLGVSWPGLESHTLRRGEPLTLRYRITVFSN